MSGGRVPKLPGERRNRHAPRLGEWSHVAGVGWRHGPIPTPPDGLLPASGEAWNVWFSAWFSSRWTPDDVPVLRQIVRLFDQVERGEATGALRTELRLLLDGYGITPKGRQALRWLEPVQPETPTEATATGATYAHLRAVEEPTT